MPTRYDDEFRRIARSLSSLELMRGRGDDVAESSAELVLDKDMGRRFLDFYGDHGLELALDRYGIYGALARRGYPETRLVTRIDDDRHAVFVEADVEGRSERLIELVVRRDDLVPHPAAELPPLRERYRVLTVDWLLLRNPRAGFTPERPRLPGQDAPGLGLGWRVLSMLARVVTRLGLDAMVTTAEYLHNAELYAREMPCFDPLHQGRLRAVLDLLRKEHGLDTAQASWAMEWGFVRTRADDAVLRWRGELMVATEEESLRAYLDSPEHAEMTANARRAYRLWLDRSAFDARWAAELETLTGE